jgi:hypothetical protein
MKFKTAAFVAFLAAFQYAPDDICRPLSESLTGLVNNVSPARDPSSEDLKFGCASDDPSFPTFDRSSANGDIRESWSETKFSNPNSHDQGKFRYFVHMIARSHNRSQHSLAEIYNFISDSVGKNPCAYLSTSIIDQSHRGTFGSVGFILQVPKENVLIAEAHDIGSGFFGDNHDPLQFNYYLQRTVVKVGPLRTADEILARTPLYKEYTYDYHPPYNEVLVEGFYHQPIKIVGVVVNRDSDFRDGDNVARDQKIVELKKLATKFGLPVVELSE